MEIFNGLLGNDDCEDGPNYGYAYRQAAVGDVFVAHNPDQSVITLCDKVFNRAEVTLKGLDPEKDWQAFEKKRENSGCKSGPIQSFDVLHSSS
jgi:hypothetical protein